ACEGKAVTECLTANRYVPGVPGTIDVAIDQGLWHCDQFRCYLATAGTHRDDQIRPPGRRYRPVVPHSVPGCAGGRSNTRFGTDSHAAPFGSGNYCGGTRSNACAIHTG